MKKIWAYILKLLPSKPQGDKLKIRYWQNYILNNILFAGTFVGGIVYVPSMALSIKEELWSNIFSSTVVYLYAVFLHVHPNLSYKTKAYGFSFIMYVLGVSLISILGPLGGGPVWLFAFPVVMGLLLESKGAISALFLNLFTMIFVGILVGYGVIDWDIITTNPIEKWIVTSLNFGLLNILVVMSVTSLLNGLKDALEELTDTASELEQSEKKYKRIFENIQDVYYEESMDGNIQELSPSVNKILKYSQDELLNTSFHKLYGGEKNRVEMLETILQHNSINDYEIHITDKFGDIHICSINASLIQTDDGNPLGIIGIFRDITNQKNIEEHNKKLQSQLDLSKKMEAIGLLAGGVAHDLNNILSSIVGYPDLIIMELKNDDPNIEHLKAIKTSGEKASEIVSDLLTLSRRGVVIQEIIDINESVTSFSKSPECLNIFHHNPKSTLELNLKADLPNVVGSSVHINKTIMNLVTNAAEAQFDGGLISISTKNLIVTHLVKSYVSISPGSYVILSVSDQGSGIKEEDLLRIFEPFFTKKMMGRSGSGLGMAVVWGTMQDHNGYIDIKSVEGLGTTFDLYFPTTNEKKIEKTPKTKLNKNDNIGNQEHILVVDDLEDQRKFAKTILTKFNYNVSTVSSGELAIEFLNKNNVELIILDMVMGVGMDGLDTYLEIIKINPKQKVLITSGYSESDRSKKIMKYDIKYLKKPFDLQNFVKTVKKLINKQ